MGLGGQIAVFGQNQFKKLTLSLSLGLEIRVYLKWVGCTF